ncbi:MAG: alanine:cation symporter family protein, partial [Christensenellaceae bacterium]|nr:alanine:cation symporter family protein [Christensenellaceae bacterium]
MLKRIKQLSPVRIIALGFALVILLGSLLLMLPCSRKEDVSLKYIDSLYVSTSAVCVTGLITVDPGDTFSVFGQIILAVLIQIGGLGVATCGAAVFLAIGKKFDLKSRNILKEAYNLDTRKGIVQLLKTILLTTVLIELTGAVLGFFVFIKDYPPLRAIGLSLFHAVSAFNNAGFDILGGFQSMVPYQDHLGMNLLTAALIILGGIKSIGRVASILVPFMSLLFIVMALVVIFANVTMVGAAFGLIFKNIFSFNSALAGVGGYA